MQNIDELMRQELKGVENQPPEGVWDEIKSRMTTDAVQTKPSTKHFGRGLWISAAAVAVAAGMALFLTNSNEAPVIAETTQSLQETTMPEQHLQTVNYDAPQQTTPEKTTCSAAKTTSPKTANGEDYNEPVFTSNRNHVANHAAEYQDYSKPTSETKQPSSHEHVYSESPSVNAKAVMDTVVVQDLEPKEVKRETPKPENQPEIRIPNMLTPNGDGYNDCWVIPDLQKYGAAQVQLFTPKGKRVYSSANYQGDFCGNDLPDGTYFYTLAIRELNYVRRGVLVIRRE